MYWREGFESRTPITIVEQPVDAFDDRHRATLVCRVA